MEWRENGYATYIAGPAAANRNSFSPICRYTLVLLINSARNPPWIHTTGMVTILEYLTVYVFPYSRRVLNTRSE